MAEGATIEEINKALENMRMIACDPAKRAEMQVAWNATLDRLETFYKAMRPLPKVFEVHHMNEMARWIFACAIYAGEPLPKCTELAVAKITGH